MTAGWVAGSVRSRAMSSRRLGPGAARALAASSSVDAALAVLARSPYGHDVRPGQSLAEAQRAVVDTFVWNMRVLCGWVPRDGVTVLRVLLGALEIANVEDHLRRLSGTTTPPPYRLGALGTVWTRLVRTTSLDEVRRVLAASAWGDPGPGTARQVGLAMRISLADRVVSVAPDAAAWASGAAALVVAGELVSAGGALPARLQPAVARVLGADAAGTGTVRELARDLRSDARWAVADVTGAEDLWIATGRWWRRVESDGLAMVRRASQGPEVLVGTLAVMAADAWRVRAALEVAARGGQSLEVFDAVA